MQQCLVFVIAFIIVFYGVAQWYTPIQKPKNKHLTVICCTEWIIQSNIIFSRLSNHCILSLSTFYKLFWNLSGKKGLKRYSVTIVGLLKCTNYPVMKVFFMIHCSHTWSGTDRQRWSVITEQEMETVKKNYRYLAEFWTKDLQHNWKKSGSRKNKQSY